MKPKFSHFSTFQTAKAIAFIVAISVAGSACQKNETIVNQKKGKSILYVSNADTSSLVANLDVYNRADADMPMAKTEVNTGAKDGNGVFVDIKTNTLFQLSRQKKTLYIFSGAQQLMGDAMPTKMFTDSTLSSGREIAYDKMNNTLFIANNSDSSIRVYANATMLNGSVVGKKIKIPGQPWGIHYDEMNDRLLVLIDLAGMRVEVYNHPAGMMEGSVMPNSVLNVSDRLNGTFSRLHGITYSSKLDMLFVTEIGEAALPVTPAPGKPAFNADGGILIFEGATQKLTTGGTFAATKTIYGSATGLGNPVDIAIDDTNEKLVYVAEKANKKILAFSLAAVGNTMPAIEIVSTKSPEDIFIDATRPVTYTGKN